MIRWLLLLVVLAGVACGPRRDPVSPDPGPLGGAGGAPGGDECGVACARWQALGCEEGAPTPAGDPCEAWCRTAEADGIDMAGPVECTWPAGSCAAVTACAGS